MFYAAILRPTTLGPSLLYTVPIKDFWGLNSGFLKSVLVLSELQLGLNPAY